MRLVVLEDCSTKMALCSHFSAKESKDIAICVDLAHKPAEKYHKDNPKYCKCYDLIKDP